MSATMFQGAAEDFVALSRRAFESGGEVGHFLGGTAIELAGDRAIAQTKMTITQRAELRGVLCEAICTGRFYDFFSCRDGRWAIVRRQPVYERDRLALVAPGAAPELDQALLAQFPQGYRHLAYLQSCLGLTVRTGMPGLRGAAIEDLYAEGADWLAGATSWPATSATPSLPSA